VAAAAESWGERTSPAEEIRDKEQPKGHPVAIVSSKWGETMRSAYRILAIIIAIEVVIQAMMIVFAVAGLGHWVDGGGTLDKAAFESEDLSFTGVAGFMVHGINGMMIIPLLGLALLVVSFFAKVPGGVKWAAILFGLVAAQVLLGIFAHELPSLGAVHGLNALAVFSVALLAAHRARRVPAPVASSDPERATV